MQNPAEALEELTQVQKLHGHSTTARTTPRCSLQDLSPTTASPAENLHQTFREADTLSEFGACKWLCLSEPLTRQNEVGPFSDAPWQMQRPLPQQLRALSCRLSSPSLQSVKWHPDSAERGGA